MMKRRLSMPMVLILVLGMFSPFLPFALYFRRAAFSGDLAFAIIFCLIACEKIHAMIFRLPDKNLCNADKDWTAVAVGLTYVGTMYAVVGEFFYRGEGIRLPWVSLLGFLVYASALSLRYWAFHHLGRQWAIQLDKAGSENRELIRTGPYGLIRHPLYLGACLECLSIPLIFNSFWALLLGAASFIPLELARARFEERFLQATFGGEYEDYKRDVHGFLPFPARKR